MRLHQVFKVQHVNTNEHTCYAIMTQSKVQVILAGVKFNRITKKKKTKRQNCNTWFGNLTYIIEFMLRWVAW